MIGVVKQKQKVTGKMISYQIPMGNKISTADDGNDVVKYIQSKPGKHGSLKTYAICRDGRQQLVPNTPLTQSNT